MHIASTEVVIISKSQILRRLVGLKRLMISLVS